MMQSIKIFWKNLPILQRKLLSIALGLLLLLLVIFVLLFPAYKTIKQAPQIQQKLQAELQQTTSWAEQVVEIKKMSAMSAEARNKALQQSSDKILSSSAKITSVANTVTITVTKISSKQLLKFLQQAKTSARAIPSEIDINRSTDNAAWDGNIVFNITE